MAVTARCNPVAFAAVLALLAPVVGGCAAWQPQPTAPATRAWAESAGKSLRSDAAPAGATPHAAPAKKEPFWQKYRDRRVEQINRNLDVQEPPGF